MQISGYPRLADSGIQNLITLRANSILPWAQIVVFRALDMDREGQPLAQFEAEIHKVPAELDDLYTELLLKIKGRAI